MCTLVSETDLILSLGRHTKRVDDNIIQTISCVCVCVCATEQLTTPARGRADQTIQREH